MAELPGYKARIVLNGVTFKAREITPHITKGEGDISHFELVDDANEIGFRGRTRCLQEIELRVVQASIDLDHNAFADPISINENEYVEAEVYPDKNDVENFIYISDGLVTDIEGPTATVDGLQPVTFTLKSHGAYQANFPG